MKLPTLSLRNKLLLFSSALILVPGFLLGFIAERSGRDSLTELIGLQLARESRDAAEQLAARLRSERSALRSFAQQDLMRDVRVDDVDKRIALALRTLRDGSEVRLDYLVSLPDHSVVSASSPALLAGISEWAPNAPDAASETGTIWGPIRIGDDDVLFMATPIPDPDDSSRSLGELIGLYDWTRLAAVTIAVRSELSAQNIATDVFVARAEGGVVGGDPSLTPSWFAALAGGELHEPEYRVDDEFRVIVGRAPVGEDLPDWRLVIAEPLSLALAPARLLTNRLAVLMGLALLVAVLVAAIAARRVVEPLSELTTAIEHLSRDPSREVRVPVRTQDEVGTLGTTFNRMASELDRAQRDLVEAEKFAFVGELAAGVAHQIRTSLGVLRSSAQILERSLPPDAKSLSVELAEMFGAEVDRLAGVVDDLLRLDRRPLRLEPIPLSGPVFQAAQFVEAQARAKNVAITRVPISNEASVVCDWDLVYQICVNLLVNAISALESKGSIEVRINPVAHGIGGFSVSDNGCGIPEEIRAKIFKPFVTARSGGVGLGLTFVKRAVHDQRGRVFVESTPDGTTFRIELPAAGIVS